MSGDANIQFIFAKLKINFVAGIGLNMIGSSQKATIAGLKVAESKKIRFVSLERCRSANAHNF